MGIGLGIGLTMVRTGAAAFTPAALSNANPTGGYGLSCSGSLLPYAAHTLRWGCLDGRRAVLVEAGATNILPYQWFSSSTMLGGVSFALDPFKSVRTFTAPAGNGSRYAFNSAAAQINSGYTYTISVWVASSERYVLLTGSSSVFGFNAYAVVDLVDCAITSSVGCVASVAKMLGMCRVSITATAITTGVSGGYGVGLSDGSTTRLPEIVTNGSETLTLYGAQLEGGPVATSYIPTEGAAATRAADIVTAPITADVSRGVRVRGKFKLGSVSGSGVRPRVFQLDVGNDAPRIILYWDGPLGVFKTGIFVGNVVQSEGEIAGSAVGDTCPFDISFTPDGIAGELGGVSFSFGSLGGYVAPTIARVGHSSGGLNIPARLLCSEFIVTGVPT